MEAARDKTLDMQLAATSPTPPTEAHHALCMIDDLFEHQCKWMLIIECQHSCILFQRTRSVSVGYIDEKNTNTATRYVPVQRLLLHERR